MPVTRGVGAITRDGLRESLARLSMVVAFFIGAIYLGWRLTRTLNLEALWFSIPVLAAEAYGWVSAGMFYFMVWRPTQRQPPPAPPGLRVDVFIPTYDEPEWLVRRTLIGALHVRYPHETYVLDDGNRPEIARLARQLGCHYIARRDNVHAKAGNLNHGLQHSSGDFVAVLDADHVPMPEFLDRLLGYFSDESVAFVQTPQDFYNVESYQHWFKLQTGQSWHEQALFFRVIQPGKDRWNAAFYCGSPAVLRRKALEDVGGFAVETPTEDLHTSIRLHRRGWRSVYHNEILAYGVAPSSAVPYRSQRLRWGRGNMQVLRLENPLRVPGLTLAQRINYLASMSTYLEGWQKLIFYFSPAVCLITGVLPVRALDGMFLALFVTHYLTMYLAFKLASRGYGLVLQTEHYAMARFATYIRSTSSLVNGKLRLPFQVTPKGRVGRLPALALAPQLAVLLVNLVGLAAGVFRMSTNGAQTVAYGVNAIWATWHVYLASRVAWHMWRRTNRRSHYRLVARTPVRYVFDDGRTGVAVLRDCHEEGAGLWVREPLQPEAAHRLGVTFTLHDGWPPGGPAMTGRIVSVRRAPDGTALGIRFERVSDEIRDLLLLFVLLFTHRKFVTEVSRVPDRVGGLVREPRRRRSKRVRQHLPVRVRWEERDIWAVTEDVSRHGMRLLLAMPLPASATVQLQPWGDGQPRLATVVWQREVSVLPDAFPTRFLYQAGVAFCDTPPFMARLSQRQPGVPIQPAIPAGVFPDSMKGRP